MIPIETSGERWRRRALTIPGIVLATALLVGLLPVFILLTLAADLAFDRRFRFTRFLGFATAYGVGQCAGLAAAAGIGLLGVALGREWSERANHALEALWATALLNTGMRILSMDLTVEEEVRVGERPLIVFVRHACLLDSLLPATLLSRRFGIRLRYVLKRELLFDPCLDVVGQRLPNAFIRRGSDSADREVDAIAALANGLRPGDGVLAFPEGTRFTPEKRERALARLAEAGDPVRLSRAERLQHLLPPRSRGPVQLLESAPDADVLFIGHFGFEGAASVSDILAGTLIGRRIRTTAWRVAAENVPNTRAERLAWLDAEWARMDRWLEQQHQEAAESAT